MFLFVSLLIKMRKLFWLLLAALPLITGIASAEKIWIPDNNEFTDIKISLLTFTPVSDSLGWDFTFADAPDYETVVILPETVSEPVQKIIATNALIGSLNARDNNEKYINKFWVPKNFTVGEAMRENAINAASLVLQFEQVSIDEKDVIGASTPLRENNEFNNAKDIRAITNIRGMTIIGPIVRFDEDEKDGNTKKMQAAYALIGKVIAERIGWFTGVWDGRESLRIPDSSMLFDRRSGNNEAKGTFLGQETDLVDYTGTSSDGTTQFRNVVENLIDFLKKIMIPIAIVLVAYSGIELFLSFQDEEKMDAKIRHLTGILVGFLIMTLAVNVVDWVIFGHEGEILRGDTDVAEFAQRGFQEVSGLFDMFSSFAVIIAVGFIVYNAVTLIIAGGEDESQIAEIKNRILYSMIGIIILVSAKPIIDVFTANGQLVMPEVRGTITIVAKWINFLLGFIGVAAVLAMIYAGIAMIIHFGDETAIEKAKKIMISAAIGLIMAFSSWALIYYFIFAG